MSSQAGDFAGASRELSSADRGWEAIEAHRAFLECRALRMARTLWAAGVTASDVVQGTLVEARRYADGFRGTTQAEWRAWLLRVFRTRISRLTRKWTPTIVDLGEDGELGPIDPRTSPSQSAARRERSEALANALLWLDPRDCELLRLRHDERLEFAAIAERLGLPSADAARKRYGRALHQLREILGPSNDPA